MAKYNVDVELNPKGAVTGAKKVNKALETVGRTTDKLNKLIQTTFAFAGLGAGLAILYRYADAYANLENKLRVVTNTQADLINTTDALFKISQDTRSSLEGSVSLYSRLAISTKELGVEQTQLLNFTKSLNQAIILSGASAIEANAGMIQLSQGIASGTLRGDELRSVLEQLPTVADVIAKSLGVTRGELREMGTEGKITAETILNAFKEARVELEEKFAKSVITPGQAFTVLNNAVLLTIGRFDKALGTSAAFSNILVGLADNIDMVVRSVAALAIVIGIGLAGVAIPKAITGVRLLTAAMAANPVGALVVGLTTAISFLITFSDQISISSGSMATLADIAGVVFTRIADTVGRFVDWFAENFGFISKIAAKVFGGVNFSIQGVLEITAKTVDMLIGLWRAYFNVVKIVFMDLPGVIKAAFTSALDGAVGIVESKLNGLIGLVNQFWASVGDPKRIAEVSFASFGDGDDLGNKGKELGAKLLDGIKDGMSFSGAQNLLGSIINEADEVAFQRALDESTAKLAVNNEALVKRNVTMSAGQKAFADLLELLKKEGELLSLSRNDREIQNAILSAEKKLKRDLTEQERKLYEAQLLSNQSLQQQMEVYDAIRAPIEDYTQTVTSLNALMAAGKINATEYAAALNQTALSTSLNDVVGELGGDGGEAEALRQQLTERSLVLQQAREADLISEQEFFNLSLAANQAYNEGLLNLEYERMSMQIQAAESTAASLTSIAKAYVGEQSGVYKALFAITKAFAIADSTVQVANALAKAANSGPFPANLGAIASVAAATSSLVSTIQGANIQGFQNGGNFKVGGSGGTDSQLVQFRASPNETVSVKTPGQEKAAAAPAAAPQQSNGVRIINVVDPELVNDYMTSPQGEETFINNIQRNQGQINQILKG